MNEHTTVETPATGIGHNQPSPFEAISARIQELKLTAERWLTERSDPTKWDQEIADKCEGFIVQCREEYKKAEKQRETQKRPHLDAGKRIDARWNELKKTTKTIADMLKPKKAAYLKEQQRILDEQRKAEEEEANRLAQEAEKKRQAADAANEQAEVGEGQGLSPVEAELEAQEAQAAATEQRKAADKKAKDKPRMGGAYAGGSGRARQTGLRTVYEYGVSDIQAAMLHFKDNPKMHELVIQLARAEHTSDRAATIPGIEITQKQVA